MWHEITSDNDIRWFMKKIDSFHDGCVKEMKYVSGAYIADDFAMYPINDSRVLSVIIQRQSKEFSVIELEFSGLKSLKLYPADESFTCEILDSTLKYINGDIYWCDSSDLLAIDSDDFSGTKICASKMRWRVIESFMGDDAFYKPTV